jgi:hypothetical protein
MSNAGVWPGTDPSAFDVVVTVDFNGATHLVAALLPSDRADEFGIERVELMLRIAWMHALREPDPLKAFVFACERLRWLRSPETRVTRWL